MFLRVGSVSWNIKNFYEPDRIRAYKPCRERILVRGSEFGGGGPLVGCRLKFSNFVGSRLKFSIFAGSRLNVSSFVGRRKFSVNK